MNVTELQLRRRADERPATGVVIVATDPERVVELLLAVGITGTDRVFPIARSLTDHRPAAFFAMLPKGVEPRPLPPSVEYLAAHGTNIFTPRQGTLTPPVTSRELESIHNGLVQIFHPVLGRHAFSDAEALTLVDFLRVDAPQDTDWSTARTGPAAPPQLTEIRVEVPDVEQFLAEDARDDIGREDLPPEIQKHFDRALQDETPTKTGPLGRLAARLVMALVQRIPERGTEPTVWNRLEDWAMSHLSEVAQRVSSFGVGIDRLLEMLEQDPDLGLRHAPPLGGEGPAGADVETSPLFPDRGLPIFSGIQSRVGGGGYTLDASYYDRLAQRYRELANRELQLGRPKRAAYILAELLDDPRGAATALEKAGFYAEAAALYRDKCVDLAAAAQCLERGGLLAEAAALFAEVGMHRQAGLALLRLGDGAGAEEAFQRQIAVHLRSHQYVAAAKVLKEDLDDPEEAMDALMFGFEADHDREACLRVWFRTAGEHGYHDEVAGFVAECRKPEVSARVDLALANGLAQASESYPDAAIRAAARDCLRITVSGGICSPGASAHDRDALLGTLERIERTDPLLRRDVARFRGRQHERRDAPVLQTWSDNAEWSLGHHRLLAGASATDGSLWLVQRQDGRIVLLSITAIGLRPEATWDLSCEPVPAWILPTGRVAEPIHVVFARGGPRLTLRERPNAAPVGTPSGFPADIAGVNQSPDGKIAIACFESAGADTVSEVGLFDRNGNQLMTSRIPEDIRVPYARLPLLTTPGGKILAASEDALLSLTKGKERLQLHTTIDDVMYLAGRDSSSWAAVVSMPDGFAVSFADAFGELTEFQRHGDDAHESPRLAQLGDGRLAVASMDRLEVFTCTPDGLRSAAILGEDWDGDRQGVYAGLGAADLWEVSADSVDGILVRLVRL